MHEHISYHYGVACARLPTQLSLRMLFRFKPVLPLADAYYPEFLGCSLVINANWVLHRVWVAISGLLGAEVRKRVVITDVAGTADALHALALPENVPVCLGGASEALPAEVALALAAGFSPEPHPAAPQQSQQQGNAPFELFQRSDLGAYIRDGLDRSCPAWRAARAAAV